MASTKIPAVKEAIQAILSESAGLDGVLVTAKHRDTERENEFVWIWKAKAKRDFKTLGNRKLEESIRVTLRIVAIGNDATETEDRVFELTEAVETALRDDITLGGVVLKSLPEELEDEPLEFDNKVGHHVLLTVVADTRI